MPAASSLHPTVDIGRSLAQPSARPPRGDDEVRPRQCGRCRLIFPGDPDSFPGAIQEWWLCPPCRSALLGDKPAAPRAPR